MIIAGAAIAAFGILFHLQGQGHVGPAESFMYQNPEWVGYGLYIILAGLAVAVAGIIRIRRPAGRRA